MTKIRAVLRNPRAFDRIVRPPGFILLEGILAECCTVDKFALALQRGEAVLETVPEAKVERKEPKRGKKARRVPTGA